MAWLSVSFLLMLCSSFLTASDPISKSKKAPQLVVHLLAHSHCDAGWLFTPEQYYAPWPINASSSGGSVRKILTNILDLCESDSSFHMVWSETIWLRMWWEENSHNRSQLNRWIRAVKSGCIEHCGGGFVMNDEVVTTFDDVVTQMTYGHQFLWEKLGIIVKHGWQLDMFAGYSRATPSLWALLGFEAMVLRYEGNATMFQQWNDQRSFEFVWQASKSLPINTTQIFAHVISQNYGTLTGVGYNWEDRHPNITRNPPITSQNVQARADYLVAWLTNQSECCYQTPHLMMLFGQDFSHWTTHPYGNMSLLIDYVNSHPERYDVRLQWSTLAIYFDALYSLNRTWPLMEDFDFELGWPHHISHYPDDVPVQFQTGALTSWAEYKSLVREQDRENHRSAFLDSFTPSLDTTAAFRVMNTARSLTQHHDSMPGTCRTNVSTNSSYYLGPTDVKSNYTTHLRLSLVASEAVTDQALRQLLCGSTNKDRVKKLRRLTPLVPLSSSGGFVTVTSVLGQMHLELIRLPVASPNLAVLDSKGKRLISQVEKDSGMRCWWILFWHEMKPFVMEVFQLVTNATDSSLVTSSISFVADDSMSSRHQFAKKYKIKKYNYKKLQNDINVGSDSLYSVLSPLTGPAVIENDHLRLSFSSDGQLNTLLVKRSFTAFSFNHTMQEYLNTQGGAYLLYPTQPASPLRPMPQGLLQTGPIFSQVCSRFTSQVSLSCVRLYHAKACKACESFFEHVADIGPLNLKGTTGVDLITRYDTNLSSTMLYADATGFELYPRPFLSWGNASFPPLGVAGNYHALVYSSALKESNPLGFQLALITEHTRGVASLTDGQIETMLLRSGLTPDHQGPYPLFDPVEIRGVAQWVAVGLQNEIEQLRPALQARMTARAHVFGTEDASWSRYCNWSHGMSKVELPFQLQLMSLERGSSVNMNKKYATQKDGSMKTNALESNDQSLLLRIRHIYEADAPGKLSSPVTIDVRDIFKQTDIKFVQIERVTLNGLETYPPNRRLWPYQSAKGGNSIIELQRETESLRQQAFSPVVTIGPLEIATFRITIEGPSR